MNRAERRKWIAEVKYQMALKEITGAAISANTGYSLNWIYMATGGKTDSPKLIKAISDYLGIEPYTE